MATLIRGAFIDLMLLSHICLAKYSCLTPAYPQLLMSWGLQPIQLNILGFKLRLKLLGATAFAAAQIPSHGCREGVPQRIPLRLMQAGTVLNFRTGTPREHGLSVTQQHSALQHHSFSKHTPQLKHSSLRSRNEKKVSIMHYGVEVLVVGGGGVVIVRTLPRPRLATVRKSGLHVHTHIHLKLTIGTSFCNDS